MKKTILATAVISLLGQASIITPSLSQTLTPNTAGAPAGRNTQQPLSGAAAEAPIGHRQPTRGDVPSETGNNNPANLDAQDRELDRKIKGICKGC